LCQEYTAPIIAIGREYIAIVHLNDTLFLDTRAHNINIRMNDIPRPQDRHFALGLHGPPVNVTLREYNADMRDGKMQLKEQIEETKVRRTEVLSNAQILQAHRLGDRHAPLAQVIAYFSKTGLR
jgi:hypothetical protein